MKKYLFLVATLLLTASMTVSAQNYNNRRSYGNRGCKGYRGYNMGDRGYNRSYNMNNRRSDYMMRMTPQERVELMTKELNLTANEASDVLALCEKHEAERTQQVREHRSQRSLGAENRVTRREDFRAMRTKQMEENQAELEKIIGKEKAQKWNDLRQDVRADNRAGRMGGRGYYNNNQRSTNSRKYNNYRDSDNTMRMSPKERAVLMTEELDLTKEQTEKILILSEKHEAERIEQIREHRNKRGTGAQNRDVQREEFRNLRDKQMNEQQAEVEKIIGKEKLQKWNELRRDVRDYNRAGRRNPRYQNR